ncbi:hypothetical protein ACF0H5_006669 [Mactra antiquata]
MEASVKECSKIFKKVNGNIIGMIHILATPGSPHYKGSISNIVNRAKYEAKLYQEAGVDGVLVENMHDIPYVQSKDMGPQVISVMTRVSTAVRNIFHTGPVGATILAGANQQALSVALAADLDFIRSEGFVFSHIADGGMMNACAGPLMRYRKYIGAEHMKIFTDIKIKHSSHSITSDVSIEETAKAAEFFLSDGVIVTGTCTGHPVNKLELKGVQDSVSIPVLIGSGVTASNFNDYKTAYGLIVGSHFKYNGQWDKEIDEKKVADFMNIVRKELY